MKGDVEEEAPRPRPLSGGIWTLFSWLRRTERSSSDESITSVGSDRTTASFDYLSPLHYKRVNSTFVLKQSPLTETYKKRLHERNLRRQYDRDITLRRKYGLYTEEGLGYDAFSLPPARRIFNDTSAAQGRQRRATSESVIQPRAAYVPGKRRAPLPPSFVTSASLPRNYKRKRPAPKPPVKLKDSIEENVEIKIRMDAKHFLQKHSSDTNNMTTKCKIEKPDKKEDSSKDVKLRTEKGFLKQIFDNRKRNSAIDTSLIKVLPSISELDKQAAEIIQINKLNTRPESLAEGNLICTNCFRKYNTTSFCVYCVNRRSKSIKEDKSVLIAASNMCTQTEKIVNKSTTGNVIDEKKKLREMLKEMKDSLPKRPKQHEKRSVESKHKIISVNETPTLRIGSTHKDDKKTIPSIPINQYAEISEAKIAIQQSRNAFLTPQPSTSKQIPRRINGINDSNIGINKSLTELDSNTIQSSSSGFVLTNNVKETGKNTTLGVEKNRILDNDTGIISENIHRTTDTPGERKLMSKGISEVSKHNLNFTNKFDNISSENPVMLHEVPKVELKNKTVELNRKINNNSNVKDQIKTTENITNEYNQISQTPKNMKASQTTNKLHHLFPIKENEISVKADVTPNKKIESIRLGDVLPLNAVQKTENNNVSSNSCNNFNLNTPLKISSLLNPLYTPKFKDSSESTKVCQKLSNDQTKLKEKEKIQKNKLILQPKSSTLSDIPEFDRPSTDELKEKPVLNVPAPITDTRYLDHHAQRRDLINQLEQSIAKGDEQTAALAAAKLAKLKLACSVLSFSSQIVSGPLLSLNNDKANKNADEKTNRTPQTNKQLIPNARVSTKLIQTVTSQEKSESSKMNNPILSAENKSTEVQKVDKDRILDDPIPSTSRFIQDQKIPVDVWIEDKEATRGPILLLVSRNSLVSDLKAQAEKSLGLQIRLQRWIIGKTLCSNDSTPLVKLAGIDLTAPFYLCLVETDSKGNIVSETKEEINSNTEEPKKIVSTDVYTELMLLEQQALVNNTEEFECGVCIENCPVGKGVVLRECIHTFCRECLVDSIRHCQEPIVVCPAIACPGALQEREIRALLSPEDYEKWLARSLAAAESGTRNTFHCRTRDCAGWAFCETGVRRFPCPVCKHTNCLPCQAIHEGQTCVQYQAKLREAVSAVEINQTDNGTQALLKSLIDKGEALECPECKAIITKKWGCDWIKCSACKTEICWVTKGRRWGPGGKGDTSGGCRCGVDGKRCHPSCAYCH